MAIPALTGAYFYAFEARPHGLVLGFCGLALLCWDMLEEKQDWFWLIAFLVCLEAVVLLLMALARIVSAPLFLRYFVSAIVGIAVLFSLGVGLSSQRWVRVLLAGAVACALGISCVNTIRFYYRGWGDELIEPSTKLLMNTVPGNRPGIHQLPTSHSKEGIPVMVPFFLDFTYLQFYWSDNGPAVWSQTISP